MTDFQLYIEDIPGQTKLQQLVHAISEAINTGRLKEGDSLPSVNQLSSESGFSRDTVFKAYNILKKSNMVESAPQKGYYVSGESYKVFMLLLVTRGYFTACGFNWWMSDVSCDFS